MCRMRVGYKKHDVKTIEVVARGTKQKTGGFCFFSKKLGFVLWGLFRIVVPNFPIWR